jgi:hypothetical protein
MDYAVQTGRIDDGRVDVLRIWLISRDVLSWFSWAVTVAGALLTLAWTLAEQIISSHQPLPIKSFAKPNLNRLWRLPRERVRCHPDRPGCCPRDCRQICCERATPEPVSSVFILQNHVVENCQIRPPGTATPPCHPRGTGQALVPDAYSPPFRSASQLTVADSIASRAWQFQRYINVP